ncbi:hypothetical protein [uncultured Bacteroides sp.]|uniref:hypothetical protein n=1 Tax=uncultured Bacteroides sp. TaxID=162156 RepID=UPI002AAB220E|nr:hypothetical protein [uncultured Bacteroides sp.]
MMKPKKAAIETAKKRGIIDRTCQLLSAAYLLNSEVGFILGEVDDVLDESNLKIGDLKQAQNKVTFALDCYYKTFCSMITNQDTVNEWAKDLEKFDASFRKFANIPSDWKPLAVDEIEEEGQEQDTINQ